MQDTFRFDVLAVKWFFREQKLGLNALLRFLIWNYILFLSVKIQGVLFLDCKQKKK